MTEREPGQTARSARADHEGLEPTVTNDNPTAAKLGYALAHKLSAAAHRLGASCPEHGGELESCEAIHEARYEQVMASQTGAELDAIVTSWSPPKSCRRCGELAIAHCFGCNACPEQECPSWCDTDSED